LRAVDVVAFEGASFDVEKWNEQIRDFIQASRLDLVPTLDQ
jgi:hypothetical protein